MDTRDSEFHLRLLATFKAEAQEHLHTMAAGLVEFKAGAPSGAPGRSHRGYLSGGAQLKRRGACRQPHTHRDPLPGCRERFCRLEATADRDLTACIRRPPRRPLNTLGQLLTDSATGATAGDRLRLTESVQSLERLAQPESGAPLAAVVPPRAASIVPRVSPFGDGDAAPCGAPSPGRDGARPGGETLHCPLAGRGIAGRETGYRAARHGATRTALQPDGVAPGVDHTPP